MSGTVRLMVTIGADGKTKSVRAIDGPPAFRQAAISAVSRWEYTPTVIEGRAVEVVTQVAVAFKER